ncbi:unnamed protein product [Vitrella brassicaformis CCMP3155]|uniref:Uncharacterized protein n=1 Tax=Vitrella brassicaformis (strain CCMP3155) TaxID=1169540 RepID=A0A0G4FYI3_VITBC|nr:unnamed protein product [Vitrella brassicaformis CCMP3155]|eukprot:CEM20492.1 unnamed protein product [Vitrella brassicaformis CCMP3155]
MWAILLFVPSLGASNKAGEVPSFVVSPPSLRRRASTSRLQLPLSQLKDPSILPATSQAMQQFRTGFPSSKPKKDQQGSPAEDCLFAQAFEQDGTQCGRVFDVPLTEGMTMDEFGEVANERCPLSVKGHVRARQGRIIPEVSLKRNIDPRWPVREVVRGRGETPKKAVRFIIYPPPPRPAEDEDSPAKRFWRAVTWGIIFSLFSR